MCCIHDLTDATQIKHTQTFTEVTDIDSDELQFHCCCYMWGIIKLHWSLELVE